MVAMATAVPPATAGPSRRYTVTRRSGNRPPKVYSGGGMGFRLEWAREFALTIIHACRELKAAFPVEAEVRDLTGKLVHRYTWPGT